MPLVPSREEVERLIAETQEIADIDRLGPTKYDLIGALGEDGYRENPDGTWTFAVTRVEWSPEKNMRRLGLFNEMMERKRRAQIERSERLAADHEKVSVVNRQTGEVHTGPAWLEDRLAASGKFRPYFKRSRSNMVIGAQRG